MRRAIHIIFLVSFSGAFAASEDQNGYHVTEAGRNLELTTPDGKRVFLGNGMFDSSHDYKIRIPLKSLKPEAKPAPEAQAGGTPSVQILPVAVDKNGNPAPSGSPSPETAAKPPGTDGAKPKGDEEYDDTARLVIEANHLYNKGKFYEATAYVEELIRKKPTFLRAWIMKGSLMYVQNQKDLAKSAWEHALQLEPENHEIKDLLARYR